VFQRLADLSHLCASIYTVAHACCLMRLTPKLRCAVQAHVSSQFLEDHLFVLQPVASGQQQLSSRVVHLALQYLTHALELKDSYKLMRPHVEGLLAQVRTLTRPLSEHTAFASVRQLQTRHPGASGSVGIAAHAAVRLAYSCGLSAFVRLRLCIQVWLTMCYALHFTGCAASAVL
jgi:hypothetical protein